MALGSDPYAVLGVPRDATGTQIAQARNRLVLKYHPDVNRAPDAAERFAEVQQAYRLLSDPVARAEFDRTRDHPPPEAAPAAGAGARRFFTQPHAVNFGVIEPGKPGADRDVIVYWTGAPPRRIAAEPAGGWWTISRTGTLGSSGVVFHLHAQAPAGAAHGRQQAQLGITLDDASVAVPLTADIGRKSPSGPRPPASDPGLRPLLGRRFPLVALFPLLLTIAFALVLVLTLLKAAHH